MNTLLLVFGNTFNNEQLIKSAVFLKESLGVKINPLYIRDIEKNNVITSAGDSLFVSKGQSIVLQEILEIESKDIEEVKKELKRNGLDEELDVRVGIFNDIVTEQMKKNDIMLIGKEENSFDKLVAILKYNYKAIILIDEKPLLSLENIVLANDDGVKINRSFYQFSNLMPKIQNFEIVSIKKKDSEERYSLLEYMESKDKRYNVKEVSGIDEAMELINKKDLLIIGNLSKSYLFERIIGKYGLKLILNSKVPIFIG